VLCILSISVSKRQIVKITLKSAATHAGLQCAIGVLRLIAFLPYRWVAISGATIGAALYRLPSRRKRIALINLALCFPLKSAQDRESIARDHFRHVIRSYLERGIQWFGSADKINHLMVVETSIDLDDKNPPPTIFMGFHFVGIEMGCMQYSTHSPVTALYTRMSSPGISAIAKRQRSRFGALMIERSASARQIVRHVRAGTPVMLAADMDHGATGSVFVPFFDVPTCTLTSVSRLAVLGNARVVPFITEVLPDYRGYKMTIYPPMKDFPSGNDSQDALAMNRFLEEQILKMPSQYYWVHRRFKNRPVGAPQVY